MNIEDIIYDVKEIKAALEDDTDLEDLWLLYKINNYRAVLIAESFRLEPVINPVWLQPIEKFSFTKTNAADDPAIAINSVTLGRAILPAVVLLPDDLGFNRLSGSGGIIGFEPTDFDTLVMKAVAREFMQRNQGYYARIGFLVYIYPYVMEGKAMVIAENPLSIKIHDGTSFRNTLVTDPYPLDARLAQAVIMQILINDLKFNDQAITDIVNDAQSNLKIMKDVQ